MNKEDTGKEEIQPLSTHIMYMSPHKVYKELVTAVASRKKT